MTFKMRHPMKPDVWLEGYWKCSGVYMLGMLGKFRYVLPALEKVGETGIAFVGALLAYALAVIFPLTFFAAPLWILLARKLDRMAAAHQEKAHRDFEDAIDKQRNKLTRKRGQDA